MYAARWKYRTQQLCKNRHLRTIAQLCLVTSSQNLLKQQYLPTRPYKMVNFGPLAAGIVLLVWGTLANFNGFRVLASCSDVAHRRPTKLYTMFGRLLGCYTIYTLSGALAPDEISPRAKFTLRRSLAFFYIGSVTAQHSSSGRQSNFAAWYKEWNYRIFPEGATYIWLGGHHVRHRPTF